ncbi:hypothetical protein ES703_109707 [subsurface metagenome]
MAEQDRPFIDFIKDQGKLNLIGAEVGVLYGINAKHLLQALNIKKLYLIDPYVTYPEYLDLKQPFAAVARDIANKKLGPYIKKIDWKIMKSADAVHLIPNDLDFVYIDGNHAYEYVKNDILLYYPKVKKGGVFGGHDYYNAPPAREVKKAVDEWVAENNLKLFTGNCDWWVVKNE